MYMYSTPSRHYSFFLWSSVIPHQAYQPHTCTAYRYLCDSLRVMLLCSLFSSHISRIHAFWHSWANDLAVELMGIWRRFLHLDLVSLRTVISGVFVWEDIQFALGALDYRTMRSRPSWKGSVQIISQILWNTAKPNTPAQLHPRWSSHYT